MALILKNNNLNITLTFHHIELLKII